MTAKELLKKHISVYSGWVIRDSETGEMANAVAEYKFSAKDMKAFCDQLCREQRERCEDEIFKLNIWIDNGLIAEVVTNAPMPEL